MIDLANSEARYVALIYRQLMKLLDTELAPLELGHGRYLYLFSLYVRGGRRQQELADIIGADKAAAARALARLEAAGYISREPDPLDRRASLVFLTPRGSELRPQLEAAAARSMTTFTGMLDQDERAQFKRLLAKVASPLMPPPAPRPAAKG